MSNSIVNTTKEAAADCLIRMLPGSIEASERAGQEQLVNSDVIPADLGGREEDFEALGFKLGAAVEGDPLFRHCTLPPGWSKKTTDHDMHSYIVDDAGCERVDVFYKAAFYDRRADARLVRRYSDELVDRTAKERTYHVVDRKHGNKVVFVPVDPKPYWERADGQKGPRNGIIECGDWLAAQPKRTVVEEWAEP